MVNKHQQIQALSPPLKIMKCPLPDTVKILLAQRPLVGCFETCLRCLLSGLVVTCRKWSIDKYGRCWPPFSLGHLLWHGWSDFFETRTRCSPSYWVVTHLKWSQSINKYGRCQLSLKSQNAFYLHCNDLIRPTFLFKLIYKPADCNFRKSGKKIKYHSDGYIFIFSTAYSDIHFV